MSRFKSLVDSSIYRCRFYWSIRCRLIVFKTIKRRIYNFPALAFSIKKDSGEKLNNSASSIVVSLVKVRYLTRCHRVRMVRQMAGLLDSETVGSVGALRYHMVELLDE